MRRISKVRLIEQCLFIMAKHPELMSIDIDDGFTFEETSTGVFFYWMVGGAKSSTFVPMSNIKQIIYESELLYKKK